MDYGLSFSTNHRSYPDEMHQTFLINRSIEAMGRLQSAHTGMTPVRHKDPAEPVWYFASPLASG